MQPSAAAPESDKLPRVTPSARGGDTKPPGLLHITGETP
jgi:hypothetical protein